MNISIIIPVYNTSKFLTTCIESILSQSYLDYEVILIDDGSTDNSGSICDSFLKKDTRVRVYHKPNGGVDSARNLGIEKAKGKYLYFVDSDDMLLPNCLQTLVEGFEKAPDIDLVIGGYYYSRNGIVEADKHRKIQETIFSRDEAMEELMHPVRFPLGMPWTNLFKTSIIRNNNLTYNADIHTIDDRVFMVSYMCNMSGKVFHTTTPIYIYNLGVGVSFQIAKSYNKRYSTVFDGQCLIYQMVKENGFSRCNVWWARYWMINSFVGKRDYFRNYGDEQTVEEMRNKLFTFITKWEYYSFICRQWLKIFLTPLLPLLRKLRNMLSRQSNRGRLYNQK